MLVIPPPPLIKVASNTRPCSKLGGTTLNGREEGGQYYISQTCDQERFEARKVVFSWECLNIFATGCSSVTWLRLFSAWIPRDWVSETHLTFFSRSIRDPVYFHQTSKTSTGQNERHLQANFFLVTWFILPLHFCLQVKRIWKPLRVSGDLLTYDQAVKFSFPLVKWKFSPTTWQRMYEGSWNWTWSPATKKKTGLSRVNHS